MGCAAAQPHSVGDIMEAATLISFVIYSFVTSVTPGPNNFMLTASGVNFGFKRSIPHIVGIGFGFGLMVAMVGFGLGSILIQSPVLLESMRVVGIVYLLYLAWKIANAGAATGEGKVERPMGFINAAVFQWINPKAWIMTMGAITTYTNSGSHVSTFLLIGLIYGIISIPSVGVWALVGERFQTLLNSGRAVAIFNITMGGLLAFSTISSMVESYQFIKPYLVVAI